MPYRYLVFVFVWRFEVAAWRSSDVRLSPLTLCLCVWLCARVCARVVPISLRADGFVLNDWDLLTVLVLLIGISAIALIKELIKPRLIDLL